MLFIEKRGHSYTIISEENKTTVFLESPLDEMLSATGHIWLLLKFSIDVSIFATHSTIQIDTDIAKEEMLSLEPKIYK